MRSLPERVSGPPGRVANHVMKQGDTEKQADWDAGMEKGGGAKATDWHPPASSSSSSVVPPGPADGGALDFRNTKMAVLGTLSEEERSALLAVLPRCQKHLDYLGHDPNSGLRWPFVLS